MPKQLTTKRKAEEPHHGPKAMPTKKLQKAFSQPALNSPPRPASATDLSLSESPSPPSLTSGSSIEDSSSLTTNSSVDKSSASTASIEKSSSASSTSGVPPATGLQELEQPRKLVMSYSEIVMPDLDALLAMSKEELDASIRADGREPWFCMWNALILTVGVQANSRLDSP